VATRLGVRTRATVRSGASDAPVITWGLRTPQLLVPSSVPRWSDAQLRVVLTHELSHVARRDWVWLVLMEIAKAVYWWEPLMWIAVRSARRDAEHACDDFVLRQEERPSQYAQVLVELARTTHMPRSSVVTPITQVSFLEGRISAMLDNRIDHAPVRPLTRWLVATPLVLVSLAAAGAGAQTPGSSEGTVVGVVRPSGGHP
jgi:bla regulator protein blaR1